MLLLNGAEIKILTLMFLKTVYTLQGITTKQKGTTPSISIWVHSLVILFIVLNLLFIVYILKKFFDRKYTHMNLMLHNENINRFSSKDVEITFNEVSEAKEEYKTTLQTKNMLDTSLIVDLVDQKSVLEENVFEIDKDAHKSAELIPINDNMNNYNSHKENMPCGKEPELSKYFVYDSSDSIFLETELDRIYNYKWCEGDIKNRQTPFEKDTASEYSSSVSYHEGEVFSIAINGDPNINNITAKEAMKPTKIFTTFTEK